MQRKRNGQIIITTSFLTVLVMLTIAFVAYSAAIYNTKPFFDDYSAIALNFRSSSDAMTRHIIANLTAFLRSKGATLTTAQLNSYINTVIAPILNAYEAQFSNYAYSKSISIKIVPASSFTNPTTTLFNGTAVNWPGLYQPGAFPPTVGALPKAYSLASYTFYLNITSDSLTGYKFTSTALESVNVTGTSKPDSTHININLAARNEQDFELNLNIVSALVHDSVTGWHDYTAQAGLFSFVNGTYSLTINAPSTNADQVSFAVFDPRNIIISMNSTL